MISDPIADMLTRIRNALMAGKPTVDVPRSKMKVEIARILKEEGFIEDYTLGEERPVPMIHITLKYYGPRRTRRPEHPDRLGRLDHKGRRTGRTAPG